MEETQNPVNSSETRIPRILIFVPIAFNLLYLIVDPTIITRGKPAQNILLAISLIPLLALALKKSKKPISSSYAWWHFLGWMVAGVYGVFAGDLGNGDDSIFGFASWITSFIPSWPFVGNAGMAFSLPITLHTLAFLMIPFTFVIAALEKKTVDINFKSVVGGIFSRLLAGFFTLFAFFFLIWAVDAVISFFGNHPIKAPTRWFIFIRR
jgi:hypothetical protein